VFHWYDEFGVMLPVEVSYSGNTLIVEADELGDYFVVDLDEFYNYMDIVPDQNISPLISETIDFTDFSLDISAELWDNEMAENIPDGEPIPIEEVFDIFTEVFEPEIIPNNGFISIMATAADLYKPVDIVFLLDCSENIGANFDNVKENIIKTAKMVYDNFDEPRFAVIGFNNTSAFYVVPWVYNASYVEYSLNTLTQNDDDESYFRLPIEKAANELVYRDNVQKFGVLIFDPKSRYEDDADFTIKINKFISMNMNFSILTGPATGLQPITVSLYERTGGYRGTNIGDFSTRLYSHITANTPVYGTPPVTPPVTPDYDFVNTRDKIMNGDFSMKTQYISTTYNGRFIENRIIKGHSSDWDGDG
jgi:hypothetical protein